MLSGTEIVVEYVNRLNQQSSSSSMYRTSIEKAGHFCLISVTKNEIKSVIEPYLYEWGRMGRVLGRVKYINWREDLMVGIISNSQLLEDYRKKTLSETELSFCKPNIETLYTSFSQSLGPIGAAKVLHLICPAFFPLWDTKIAVAARKERSTSDRSIVDFSADDYYRFTEQVLDVIVRYNEVISTMATRYGKTKVRIVDECFWWATQRPLSLIL
ncbi:MAG: hypothetical protein HQ553_16395 [Chloroflexi bacterium]|nr:hypothetical protein [Chloroflexota bacterium]